MSGATRKWADLKTRTLTAMALAAVAGFALWAGGAAFSLLVGLACAAMTWELARIAEVRGTLVRILFAVSAGLAFFVVAVLQQPRAVWAFLLVIAVFLVAARRLRSATVVCLGAVFLTGVVLVSLRDGGGMAWVGWVMSVVIASDIAAYLAGRAIGGPKFWPSISPKKTWSGTIAGWVAAMIVGMIFAPILGAGWVLIPVSAALALCGQLGDIAESAMKRAAGIKDSSNLLPGHGGVLDRFDALIGASIGLVYLGFFFGFPG